MVSTEHSVKHGTQTDPASTTAFQNGFLPLHPSILLSFFLFPGSFLFISREYDLSWWLRERKKEKMFTPGEKKSLTPLMYSFKRIDAVAQKKINLSRHQAQEPLLRGMGVNCKAMTMPALQMDFSVCVFYWEGVEGSGRRGVKSNFVSARQNFQTGVILIH